MNRFKKELVSRGIIYENDGGYEEGRSFVAIEGNYILTLWGCNVLPVEWHIFDKNFKLIGTQLLFPERKLFSEGRTWMSEMVEEESK
jgi:hypothetical protein